MLTFSMGKQDPLQSWPHKNTAERKDPSRGGSKNRGGGGAGTGFSKVPQPVSGSAMRWEGERGDGVPPIWLLGNFQGEVDGRKNLIYKFPHKGATTPAAAT